MSDFDDALTSAAAQGMTVALYASHEPDRMAVTAAGGTRTYAELNSRANQLARALRARGVAAGDGLAVLCGNRPEFVDAYVAAHRGGLRLTTINWHLTAEEAGYIANDCGARVLVADARFAAVATATAAHMPAGTILLAAGGDIAGFESFEAFLAGHAGTDIDDPVLGSSMLYTSGTTGRPKGVHRAEQARVTAASLAIYGYRSGDVHLCTGPLYHAAPLAFSLAAPLNAGVGVVLMDSWNPEDALRLIAEHRVTHTHMVPFMFHRLLALPAAARTAHDVSSIRQILHGAAPCPVSVKQAIIDWFGPVVVEYYAATEGLGTLVDSAAWLERPGTVGRPILPGGVIVGDEAGEPLPPGETGLVYIKAPSVGRFEYFGDPAKTSSAYRGDYFTLGDVGYMDGDGFLFLTDRSANLIISGGVNIYPAEVDAVLLGHPAVADAATIGIPNPEWGEEVKAVVELRDGYAASDELAGELIAHCRDNLAHFKCPRTVDFTDQLPRQDNGKIYKRLLRDRYRDAQEQPEGAAT